MAHIAGLVEDCSISNANALEILQSSTNPPIYMSPSLDELICFKQNHHNTTVYKI